MAAPIRYCYLWVDDGRCRVGRDAEQERPVEHERARGRASSSVLVDGGEEPNLYRSSIYGENSVNNLL